MHTVSTVAVCAGLTATGAGAAALYEEDDDGALLVLVGVVLLAVGAFGRRRFAS